MMMMGTKKAGRAAPARHPMRRTTSMTVFAPPDVLADVAEEEGDEETELQAQEEAAEEVAYGWIGGAAAKRADWLAAYRARAAPALVGHRRNSADFSAVETAAFLRACGLCSRRLGPGRDTFMYRGDTAFCSLECREQHITHEEWKDKAAALATPKPTPVMADPVAPASASSDKPPAGGTLAAA